MSKATKATVQRRIEDVLRIRLDGAQFWDVREYAREKEQEEGSAWHLAEGDKPLSDGQLWRYIGQADKLIAESCRASRKKLFRRHLAQRRNLFSKANLAGDFRTALAALKDEAELLGLYPNPLDDLAREVEALKKALAQLEKDRANPGRHQEGRAEDPGAPSGD